MKVGSQIGFEEDLGKLGFWGRADKVKGSLRCDVRAKTWGRGVKEMGRLKPDDLEHCRKLLWA